VEPAIVVRDLWKQYKLGAGHPLARLWRRARGGAPPEEFWALSAVDFALEGGETLGVIGKNGAGKTTLLKLLCGVTRPTRGECSVRGRIAPLIEVGAGFHPELTGRENVYLNASLLGMTQKETRARFDEIVEFAGLQRFIDAPVKRYSSGMMARLGFSVAVAIEPDVLLVDEELSVGDLAFVQKSYQRIEALRSRGVPALLVSHNLQLVRSFCTRALWLDRGRVAAHGSPKEVCGAFLASLNAREGLFDAEVYRIHTDPDIAIAAVRMLDGAGAEARVFRSGEPMAIELTVTATRPTDRLLMHVAVWQAETGALLVDHNNLDDGAEHAGLPAAGEARFVMRFARCPFLPGLHRVTAIVSESISSRACDWHEKMYSFEVAGDEPAEGLFRPFPRWELEEPQA
jgi:ABC-type polysaccharide/polyol phosphate transport system ATPase subunit